MTLNLQLLRKEVKQFGKGCPRLKERLLALIELTKFRQKHRLTRDPDYERIALRCEVSGRTLRRWEAAYLMGGVSALKPKKAPGRPPSVIRGHTAKKIREMRKLYNWGAEVIQAHLKHDHGINLTRHKINRYLRSKGLLGKKKRKIKAKKKHNTVVKVDHPGQHTQTDVKHLPSLLKNRKKCYVYNFVDHASKWSFKRAYDSYGPSETKDFMAEVIKAAPFAITRAQTDNGVEFTYKYVSHEDNPKQHALEELCALHEIRHVLIPPGEKELQGLVERSHRQDDEELYHRVTAWDLKAFNKILSQHCEWRNAKRRRKAIDWKTSDQFITEYREKIQQMLWGNDEKNVTKVQANREPADESNISAILAA